MIPWQYHRLTLRDQGTDLLRVNNQRLAASGAAATLVASYRVPPERLFMVTQICAFGAAGGGQTNTRLTLIIYGDQAGSDAISEFNLLPYVPFGGSLATAEYRMQGSPCLLVPPNALMTFTAFFSAGVAANALTIGMNGLLVPHGTFSE